MIAAFQTERLTVVPWAVALADPAGKARLCSELSEMLTEPVLRDLPPAVQDLSAGVEVWIAERDRAAHVFTVHDDGVLLGLLFLFSGETEDVSLGYLFGQAAWGKGYATELVMGVLSNWQRSAGARIFAGVAQGNPASARVLIKSGFVEDQQIGADGIRRFYWRAQ